MSSFTKKTVVTTVGGRLSKSIDNLMQKGSEMLDKGMGMLDAGMDVLDETLSKDEHSESVTTTIRIRLTHENLGSLLAGRAIEFKAGGTIVKVEKEK